MKKMYFSIDTPGGPCNDFKRYAYQLMNDKSKTLIQYCGDHTKVIDFPHGNMKNHPEKNFVRTCPSYLSTCKTLIETKTAGVVYKKEVAGAACDDDSAPVYTPRNLKQLRNLRHKHLNQLRISHDTLYNLHEIAYDIPGFIWKITTFPDLLCICGLEEIISEFNRVILVSSHSRCQLLSYDTTFQLGDFYVSTLLFRHIVFEQSPCIPVMFLIHERKFTETHEQMFEECAKQIPSLTKTQFAIVTDREKSIIKALKGILPTVKVVHCWNHIIKDVQLWCRKHGAPKNDISIYCDDLRELFHSANEKDYELKLKERADAWDALFRDYYMKEIHPDVSISIGRWVLDKYCIYNPYSGITNNQSEGFNRYV